MKTITAERVAEEIERGSVQVINVLDQEQFTEEHIPGSINVPVGAEGFETRVEQLVGDKGQRIIVYCASASCDASETAAERLEQAGFSHVLDFAGGMDDWKNHRYAVAHGDEEVGRPQRSRMGDEPSRRAGEPQPRPNVR